MGKVTYTVILERNKEGGYTVTVPALKGCITQGETVAQSLERAKEAIECYLEALALLGEAIPKDLKVLHLDVADTDEAIICKVTASPDFPKAKGKVKARIG
ncbi:MAG: hypothetical protein OXFUSZZB_001409 [Candidatus Fervidibacter sp.]|jgi:predicted RNase H-like HicB family nuclease